MCLHREAGLRVRTEEVLWDICTVLAGLQKCYLDIFPLFLPIHLSVSIPLLFCTLVSLPLSPPHTHTSGPESSAEDSVFLTRLPASVLGALTS